jgi:hypothetical protein
MMQAIGEVISYAAIIIGAWIFAHTCFKICEYIDWKKQTHVTDMKDKLSEKEWHSFEKVLDILDNDMGTEEFSNLMEEDTDE